MSGYVDSRAPTTTFLTHYFGGGLIEMGECYVVERFRAMSNGEICHWPGKSPVKNNGRDRPKPEVASLNAVQELRPAYNEIIVCTGLGTRSGVQYWGYAACGLFGDRTKKR